MERLEFLRDKADNIWYQHTVKTDLGKYFETISNFKELLRKLKATERELRRIQKKNSSNREYIKTYCFLLSKRMEICTFLINEFQESNEVDGVKYDKLMQEMKNRQDEFLAIRRQKMQRR